MQGRHTQLSDFGLPYAPNLNRSAPVTAPPQRPREDLLLVRAPDGSHWRIAATSHEDEFEAEPWSGCTGRRYTGEQVNLMLCLSAAAVLAGCLDEDLGPDDGVTAVLADAWLAIVSSPLSDRISRDTFDDDAGRVAGHAIKELLTRGLIERRFPDAAEPRQCLRNVAEEVDSQWGALWRAAAASGGSTTRRMLLWATYFGKAARAQVPVAWISPGFKHVVVERVAWVSRDLPGHVTVQRVEVTTVVKPGSRRGVPRALRAAARAIGAADPGSPLIIATVSDGKHGGRRNLRVLAHRELALALPGVDAWMLDQLERAVEVVPRDLPRMPDTTDDQGDVTADTDPADDQGDVTADPDPAVWRIKGLTTPSPTAETTGTVEPVAFREEIGDLVLFETLTVARPRTQDRIDGLILTDEEELNKLRVALAKAFDDEVEWPQYSPALQYIVGAGQDSAGRAVGLSHLYRAVGLRESESELDQG